MLSQVEVTERMMAEEFFCFKPNVGWPGSAAAAWGIAADAAR